MANRIFTTNDQNQYSTKELNVVDWNEVAENIPAVRRAQAEGASLSAFGLLTGFLGTGDPSKASHTVESGLNEDDLERLAATNDETEEPATETRSAGKAPWLEKYRFKKKDGGKGDTKNEKEDNDGDDGGDGDGGGADSEKPWEKHGKEAKASGPIVFTDPAQLSASALRKAEADGNIRLAKAILAAREERRARSTERYAEALRTKSTREAQLRRRAQYRQSIVDAAEEGKQVLADTQTAVVDFENPTEMSEMKKSIVAAKAQAMGFDNDFVNRYIEALCGSADSGYEQHKSALDRIAATAEPMSKKAEKIEAMVREAKLDDANKRRLYDYWTKELGYDKDWAAKLFLTNYEE